MTAVVIVHVAGSWRRRESRIGNRRSAAVGFPGIEDVAVVDDIVQQAISVLQGRSAVCAPYRVVTGRTQRRPGRCRALAADSRLF